MNSHTNATTTPDDELEKKIFQLTVTTSQEFMKTKVLKDWTLSKQIIELVNAHIQQNYTPNSEVERVKREAKIEVLNRVKGMAVYEADNPDREYVWTWKIDREIVAIEQLSHGEDK